MPIKINHPRTGTPMKPTLLPAKFFAVGTKDDAEVPVGLLMSVNVANHKPDGKIVIPGRRIVYKKKDAGPWADHPKKWAMYFKMDRVRPNQFLSLVVFDGASLAEGMNNVAISPARCDFIQKKPRVDNRDSLRFSIDPPSNSFMPYDQFVAYGELPPGDYDIGAGTQVENAAHTPAIIPPDWSWTDSEGFFAAFFPTVGAATHKVKLKVVFVSSDTTETSNDITLY